MQLKEIYRPVQRELAEADKTLRNSLKSSRYKSILEKSGYLLEGGGKKLRTILVLLSAKAISPSLTSRHQLIKIAAGVELIHMASLLHDDVIDHSQLRHNKPTINCKWGEDVAIALGDYLYSVAFELISSCDNSDSISCISSATKSMCEGELIQVCERDNLDLLKERYIFIVKKKTATLFAASCEVGAMVSNPKRIIQSAVKQYGLNFGIAFQIVDDCLDLISRRKDLGKSPGADFKMGELTLPVLNLFSQSQGKDKERIISLLKQQQNKDAFQDLRRRFINSPAFLKTKEDISFYIQKAKQSLNKLGDSDFKNSLLNLADFTIEKLTIRE